ncbi:MAG: TonB-dependent receptor [Bacteroidetes bacterium]|nr:TonB-dependent receptor [Bacteroidota bacterium]
MGSWSVQCQTLDSKPRPIPPFETVDSVDTLVMERRELLLPTIRLPEYVILGSPSIELQAGEKQEAPLIELKSSSLAQRVEEKSPFVNIYAIDRWFSKYSKKFNRGYARASGGMYSTYAVEINHSDEVANTFLSGSATYYISKGYAPYTDRSHGSVEFSSRGQVTIPSLVTSASASGTFRYTRGKYKFYGSRTPSHDRIVSLGTLRALMSEFYEYPRSDVSLELYSLRISDTTAMRIENRIILEGTTQFNITKQIPVGTRVQLFVGTSDLSGILIHTWSQRYEWNTINVEGALNIAWCKGMLGQNLIRLSPNIRVFSELIAGHIFSIAYQPMVQPSSVFSLLTLCPYIHSSSSILHPSITDAGVFGIESNWNSMFRSKAQVSLQKVKDYPLLSEVSQGVWQATQYETVTDVAFLGEVVAKFNVNDYFSTQLWAKTMKTSSGQVVPYVPSFEFHAQWYHEFTENIRSSLKTRYIGERTNVGLNTKLLPPYFVVDAGGEYDFTSNVRGTFQILNLTNTMYSHWLHYKNEPVTIHIGLYMRW